MATHGGSLQCTSIPIQTCLHTYRHTCACIHTHYAKAVFFFLASFWCFLWVCLWSIYPAAQCTIGYTESSKQCWICICRWIFFTLYISSNVIKLFRMQNYVKLPTLLWEQHKLFIIIYFCQFFDALNWALTIVSLYFRNVQVVIWRGYVSRRS